jgi:mono/diheme cytochrome c family protein
MRPAPRRFAVFVALMLSAASVGCSRIPGRPGPDPEVARPDEVLAFSTLYKENCAACHGENGRHGAAISLDNPVYLAVAGEQNILQAITRGVPGSLMPPFARSSGGSLTDRQVTVLAQGILQQWGTPNALAGANPPAYLAVLSPDAGHGQQAYAIACARCHGTNGEGISGDPKTADGKIGSIVNPAYLALISDQNLRSIIITGLPDDGMPDWRFDTAQPLADQQVTDVVAWLASKRTTESGQSSGSQLVH